MEGAQGQLNREVYPFIAIVLGFFLSGVEASDRVLSTSQIELFDI